VAGVRGRSFGTEVTIACTYYPECADLIFARASALVSRSRRQASRSRKSISLTVRGSSSWFVALWRKGDTGLAIPSAALPRKPRRLGPAESTRWPRAARSSSLRAVSDSDKSEASCGGICARQARDDGDPCSPIARQARNLGALSRVRAPGDLLVLRRPCRKARPVRVLLPAWEAHLKIALRRVRRLQWCQIAGTCFHGDSVSRVGLPKVTSGRRDARGGVKSACRFSRLLVGRPSQQV
jgi:hypothetical protein